jgi:hypothetical protein
VNYVIHFQNCVIFKVMNLNIFVFLEFCNNLKQIIMKKLLFFALLAVSMFSIPTLNFAQAPNLGTAADFVLFTTAGAVSNTGISQLTGNVGTNGGSSTGFGNVNGGMHDNDGVSAQCASDLLIAYNQLNSTVPNFFPAPLLGNGQTLNSGVYSISAAATLNLELTLDAQGNPSAVFIFQIQGPLSTAAHSEVSLVNGALACNVFWKIEGLVDMAAGTTMRGTIIANNAAINMNTGVTLEGRALSTAGAVTVDGVLAFTPSGCGSPVLTGPDAPFLASTECYAIFSSNGPVTNAGITHVTGDVGTNVGLTTGFDPLLVQGTIHPIPDVSTAQCADDLLDVYNYLNTLPHDIELLYPAQFGRNLVLTPHTYLLNAATELTDTLYLSAQGNADAVFVIKIYGALSTSTYSKVILTNGTKAKNVFWMVNGAVDINDYSVFNGTIVCNNGAIELNTGVTLNGSAFTTTGAISTAAVNVTITSYCCIEVPTNLHVTGVVGPGESVCENATQTVTVAGSGTTFHVQPDGSATIIAGHNIIFLDGTKIFAGGYLHAYITLTNDYCCELTSKMMISEETEVIPEILNGELFKVFPNPTNDVIYLEISPVIEEATAEITIYELTGRIIIREATTGHDRYEFSLAGYPQGIYLISVMSGDRLKTKKLIKQN